MKLFHPLNHFIRDQRIALLNVFISNEREQVELFYVQELQVHMDPHDIRIHTEQQQADDELSDLIRRIQFANPGLSEYRKVTRGEIREYNKERYCYCSFLMSPCGLMSLLFLLGVLIGVILTNVDLKYEYWSKASMLQIIFDGRQGLDFQAIQTYDQFYDYLQDKYILINRGSETNDFDLVKFQLHQVRYENYLCARRSACSECCRASGLGSSDLEIERDRRGSYTLPYYTTQRNAVSYEISGWFNEIYGTGFVQEIPGTNYPSRRGIIETVQNYQASQYLNQDTMAFVMNGVYIPTGGDYIIISQQVFQQSNQGVFIGTIIDCFIFQPDIYKSGRIDPLFLLLALSLIGVCVYWLYRIIKNITLLILRCKNKAKKDSSSICSRLLFIGFGCFMIVQLSISVSNLLRLNYDIGQFYANPESVNIIAQEQKYHFLTAEIAFNIIIIGLVLFRYGNFSQTLAGYWFLLKQTVLFIIVLYMFFFINVILSSILNSFVHRTSRQFAYQDLSLLSTFLAFGVQVNQNADYFYKIDESILVTSFNILSLVILFNFLPGAVLLEFRKNLETTKHAMEELNINVPKKAQIKAWLCNWRKRSHRVRLVRRVKRE